VFQSIFIAICLALVLHAVILVCHGLAGLVLTPDLQDGPFVVTLVVIMILKDTTFQVLYTYIYIYIYIIYYLLGTSLL